MLSIPKTTVSCVLFFGRTQYMGNGGDDAFVKTTSKIQPCRVMAKRLAFVLGGPEEMNAQIVRLTVLYEDLKIEVRGSENRLIEEVMDENSKQFREL